MNKFEIQNISVEIDKKNIINDTSLALEAGTVSVLMGPNGSGKSTLVNAIMGHPNYKIRSGKVFLEDEDVTSISTEEKSKKGIFLSFQNIPKIGGITFATFLHKSFVSIKKTDMSILEFYARLSDIADKFSIDKGILDRPLTEGLSGGEKKMSEALQLAVLKPKVAILDEIDSGVDVDAMHNVFDVVNSLKEDGTTFLIISHHPSLLEHIGPENVFVMNKGMIVDAGGMGLAKEILKNGFCNISNCDKIDECNGVCG